MIMWICIHVHIILYINYISGFQPGEKIKGEKLQWVYTIIVHLYMYIHVYIYMYIHVHCIYIYTCVSQVKKDHGTGKSRGFGFVRFFDPAVQQKVQSMSHTIKGRRIDMKHPRKVTLAVLSNLCLHRLHVCTCMHHSSYYL